MSTPSSSPSPSPKDFDPSFNRSSVVSKDQSSKDLDPPFSRSSAVRKDLPLRDARYNLRPSTAAQSARPLSTNPTSALQARLPHQAPSTTSDLPHHSQSPISFPQLRDLHVSHPSSQPTPSVMDTHRAPSTSTDRSQQVSSPISITQRRDPRVNPVPHPSFRTTSPVMATRLTAPIIPDRYQYNVSPVSTTSLFRDSRASPTPHHSSQTQRPRTGIQPRPLAATANVTQPRAFHNSPNRRQAHSTASTPSSQPLSSHAPQSTPYRPDSILSVNSTQANTTGGDTYKYTTGQQFTIQQPKSRMSHVSRQSVTRLSPSRFSPASLLTEMTNVSQREYIPYSLSTLATARKSSPTFSDVNSIARPNSTLPTDQRRRSPPVQATIATQPRVVSPRVSPPPRSLSAPQVPQVSGHVQLHPQVSSRLSPPLQATIAAYPRAEHRDSPRHHPRPEATYTATAEMRSLTPGFHHIQRPQIPYFSDSRRNESAITSPFTNAEFVQRSRSLQPSEPSTPVERYQDHDRSWVTSNHSSFTPVTSRPPSLAVPSERHFDRISALSSPASAHTITLSPDALAGIIATAVEKGHTRSVASLRPQSTFSAAPKVPHYQEPVTYTEGNLKQESPGPQQFETPGTLFGRFGLDPNDTWSDFEILKMIAAGEVTRIPENVKPPRFNPCPLRFDGTASLPFPTFMEEFESWLQNEYLPVHVVTSCLQACLTGRAKICWDNWKTAITNRINVALVTKHYMVMLKALCMAFWHSTMRDDMKTAFLALRQSPFESWSTFLSRYNKARTGLILTKSEYRRPLVSLQATTLRSVLIAFPNHHIEDLISELNDAATMLGDQQSEQPSSLRFSVDRVEIPPNDRVTNASAFPPKSGVGHMMLEEAKRVHPVSADTTPEPQPPVSRRPSREWLPNPNQKDQRQPYRDWSKDRNNPRPNDAHTRSPPKRTPYNKEAYCTFHERHGHSTEDCIAKKRSTQLSQQGQPPQQVADPAVIPDQRGPQRIATPALQSVPPVPAVNLN